MRTDGFLTGGMGISARTRFASLAPWARSVKRAMPRNRTAASTAQLQRLGGEWVEWKRQLHQRRAQEIERHLRRRWSTSSAAGPSRTARRCGCPPDSLLQSFNERLEYRSEEERQRSSIAVAKANHLLLHQTLKFTLGQDAVEMIQCRAQQPLSCAVGRIKGSERVLHHLRRKPLPQRRRTGPACL